MDDTSSVDTILMVDDDSMNLSLAQRILKGKFRLAAAKSGRAALHYLEKNRPSLILMDIKMPEMDGFETVGYIKKDPEKRSIPVIFLTADTDSETEQKCFQAGAVDFIGKPFVPDVFLSRVSRTLELERYHRNLENIVKDQTRELREQAERLSRIQESVIAGMADLIENRDEGTGKHVKNTQTYVKMILEKLYKDGSFPELENEEYRNIIIRSAPLHDIGKIKIPDSILLKPGRLTDEEFAIMKKHSEYGAVIIRDIISNIENKEYTDTAADIALYHHEKWAGGGYPEGLKGEEIPLSARIMAVADVFDALYAERCYKKPVRPSGRVLEILKEQRGIQFDPVVLDAFTSQAKELAIYLGEIPDEDKEH